jgi:hypothetical protein
MRRDGENNLAITLGIIALFVISGAICWSMGYRAAKAAEVKTKPVVPLSSLTRPIPQDWSDMQLAIQERDGRLAREAEEKRLQEDARRAQEDLRQRQPVSSGIDPGTPTVERTYSVEECRGIGHRICVTTWSEAEWSALDQLWGFMPGGGVLESGWDPLAHNDSGAHGIPQALPGSKMASEGADWYWNPETQIRWGIGYIIGRYGTPSEALRCRLAQGWY